MFFAILRMMCPKMTKNTLCKKHWRGFSTGGFFHWGNLPLPNYRLGWANKGQIPNLDSQNTSIFIGIFCAQKLCKTKSEPLEKLKTTALFWVYLIKCAHLVGGSIKTSAAFIHHSTCRVPPDASGVFFHWGGYFWETGKLTISPIGGTRNSPVEKILRFFVFFFNEN